MLVMKDCCSLEGFVFHTLLGDRNPPMTAKYIEITELRAEPPLQHVVVTLEQASELPLQKLQAQLKGVAQQTHGMVLDMRNVKGVSSSGLGALATLETSMRRSGKRLVLCSVQAGLFEMLRVTALDRLFTITDNVDGARILF
jgi:anti-anti-sigma factor